MILNVNGDDSFEGPDAATVRNAITQLPVEQFVVLSRGEEDYVQTYHNDDGSFQLEFRAGSPEEHYAAVAEDLSVADIALVFDQYLANKNDWKSNWKWEQVEFDDDFEGDLHADNAYLLNGEEFEKVAVGEEQQSVVNEAGRCTQCNAKGGEYHDNACPCEECPRCHQALHGCDCE